MEKVELPAVLWWRPWYECLRSWNTLNIVLGTNPDAAHPCTPLYMDYSNICMLLCGNAMISWWHIGDVMVMSWWCHWSHEYDIVVTSLWQWGGIISGWARQPKTPLISHGTFIQRHKQHPNKKHQKQRSWHSSMPLQHIKRHCQQWSHSEYKDFEH